MQGFRSFPQPLAADKVRGKPEKFADFYTQATLFWHSQSEIEKAHIIRGFRFELSKVQVPAIRERVLSMIANVDAQLVSSVAEGLGLPVPEPMTKVLDDPARPEVTVSPALSLLANAGDGRLATRHIAILLADGMEGDGLEKLSEGLAQLGAVVRHVGTHLGSITTSEEESIEVDATLESTPSVLYDAVVVPGGQQAADSLSGLGQAVEFIKDQYRHCKPLLILGEGSGLLESARIPTALPNGDPDPGLLLYPHGLEKDTVDSFAAAIAKHRHFERAVDPPPV